MISPWTIYWLGVLESLQSTIFIILSVFTIVLVIHGIREVLVIDVKNNIKGNLQVLVEISDLTRRWIPIWAIRSWGQLYDKV